MGINERIKAMETDYLRKVSPVERLFTILAETDPPFCNTMIVEGEGEIDEAVWKKAVAEACQANPGSRLVYKGRSLWAKWIDSGVATPVRFVDGSRWSGYDSEGASFLYDPLPFKTDYSSEVLVVKGSPTRVVFRTSHATMDGTGTWLWALDIFRALRGEPLEGALSTFNDKELVAKLNFSNREPRMVRDCLAPTGRPDGDEKSFSFVWKRVTLQGKFSKLLTQMTMAAAKEARKQGQGNVRIAVPLDLRKRVPDTCSTANLSRRIILDVPPESTFEEIDLQLKHKLGNLNRDTKTGVVLTYLPSTWLKNMVFAYRTNNLKHGMYRDSGTISNGGKLPIEPLRGAGFETKSFFWIPPQLENKPFFLSTIGYNNTLEMVTGMPKNLASQGRLDQFVSNIIAELKQV